MADLENRPPDDTGLADDLLTPGRAEHGPGEPSTAGPHDPEPIPPEGVAPEPTPATRGTDDDDLDLDDTGGRSRVTTALIIAVIFVVGVFVGVLLGRVLIPTPPPQTIYILDDGGAPASPSAAPTASSSPTG